MSDRDFLNRCIELARKGGRKVFPNPRVGAVLVQDGRIIGEGFHPYAGGPHAEVAAVRAVRDRERLREATLYVSLEPCNHFGKTPPCTDLILESGIPRVVVGSLDPNPQVSGQGIARLRAQGVAVSLAADPWPFVDLNAPFFINQQLRRPYITLKWARSADGYLAATGPDGAAMRTAITGEASLSRVHRLRATHHAIMVGRHTAAIDNPRLNTRAYYGSDPIRIVMDPELRLSPALHLFQDGGETIVLNRHRHEPDGAVQWHIPDTWTAFSDLIASLYSSPGICSILVEGGTRLLQQFLDAELYDEVYVFEGTAHLGKGLPAPVLPVGFAFDSLEQVEADRLFYCRKKRYQTVPQFENRQSF